MKQVYRYLSCALFLFATLYSFASDGIIQTYEYKICPGDEITVSQKKVVVTSDTIIYDTLRVTNPKADSIYVYVVNVYQTFLFPAEREIEAGTSFEWYGMIVDAGGSYEKIFKSEHGCDSIYRLHVTVTVPQILEICNGETVTFNGEQFTQAGTYFRNYSTDTIYKISVVVHPTVRKEKTDHMDVTHPYYWTYEIDGEQKTDTITEPGRYYHTVQNPETGCYDTLLLNLSMDDTPYYFKEYQTICENDDDFVWRGKTGLNRQGIGQTIHYFDKYRTLADRDSIYELILTVNPVPRITRTIPFCGSIEWKGELVTKTCTFVDTFASTRYGCDSIVTTLFTKGIPFHKHDSATIVPGETLYWRGKEIIAAGLYEDKYISSLGCDSIYSIGVGMKAAEVHTNMRTFMESTCQGEGFLWREKTYYNADTYVDTVYTDDTKTTIDSLYVLVLSVNPSYELTERISFHTFPAFYRGEQIDQPGVYPFQYQTALGCDSTITVYVDKEVIRDEQTVTICYGDEYDWFGQKCREQNRYVWTEKDKYENDSVEHILNLTVINLPDQYITKTICRGSSYTFGDRTLTESGEYVYISYEQGCKQTIHLSLNVLNADTIVDVKHINPDDPPYTWPRDNKQYEQTGVYFHYGTDGMGCETVAVLILTVNHVDTIDADAIICAGETMEWHGISASQTGDYSHADQAADGHYNFYRLHLTVRDQIPESVRHIYACEQSYIDYNGERFVKDTVVTSHFASVHGCDSVETVYIHFNVSNFYSDTIVITNQQLPYIWTYQLAGPTPDTTLTAAGTYHHRALGEGNCYNFEELVLIVNPSYLVEEHISVCETELPYFWQNGPISHRNDPLQHQPGTTMSYEYRETSVFGTDSIYRLYLTIDKQPKKTETYYVCDGTPQVIYGRTYGDGLSTLNTIDKFTLGYSVPGSACDGELTVEVTVVPLKTNIQTVILEQGGSITWNEKTITTGGVYRDTTTNVGEAGCDSISILRVIEEQREERNICKIDTGESVHPDKRYPYVWPQTNDTLNTSGIYYDTIFDTEGYITEYHTLYLTISQPYDTTVYVHGCQNVGASWRDTKYDRDTTFVDRVEVTPYDPSAPCDSVFHVHIIIDTVYSLRMDTTLCEYQLPLIVGRLNPDTIWEEGNFRHDQELTQCGCDSIIEGHLTIIPKLTHNDSTFVCEDFFFTGGSVVLGDTIHPAFMDHDGQRWAGKWEGKWKGVSYHQDTIVWDCDHNYFHHIFVRPRQEQPSLDTFYLCAGDSVQLLLPYKDKWFYGPGLYKDTIKTNSAWEDPISGHRYNDRDYLCDSIIHWRIIQADTVHMDTTVHIPMGDSIWWAGMYRYATGSYDSISQAPDTNSLGEHCKLTFTLHLSVDSTYYYQDTLTLCEFPNKEIEYIWADGKKHRFTLPDKDSAFHNVDTLLTTIYRFDSIYDLYVEYHRKYYTQILDTLCYGDSLQFDIHHFEQENNITVERYLKEAGTYVDTLQALNGCDSIIDLRLFIRDRIPVHHATVERTDRELPYLWKHTWKENGLPVDSTDTLRATGEYRFVMPSIYGCDSIDSLSFRVHQTHVFHDTINVCAPLNKSLKHTWNTGYIQEFITPLMDDTVFYSDTLQTRIKFDSIYVLCVNFHQTYETEIRDTICEGDSYRFDIHHGTETIERWVQTAGTYRDTIESKFGCDSALVLRLYVRNRIPVSHTTVHIPDTAAPYVWKHAWIGDDGQPIDSTLLLYASGDYECRMKTIYGCDSIDSLSLFIHKTYFIREDTINICQSETPFTWQDRTDITDDCDLQFHTLTADGYDSIRYVHINVLPVLHTLLLDTLCFGDSVHFGLTKSHQPRFLHTTGVYYDTLTSYQFGCDSIIELRLNVYPKLSSHSTVHIVDTAAPYIWYLIQGTDTIDSIPLSGTGEYAYHFTSTFGCDSIDSLSLYIHQTYHFTDDTINICSDEVPFTWRGLTNITTTDDYTFTALTREGYDSIYNVHINVWPVERTILEEAVCEGYSFMGYTEQGTYVDTLTSMHGCDSIIILHLTVHPKYYRTVERSIFTGDTVHFENDIFREAGIYPVRYTSVFGCDSIIELHLSVNNLFDDSVSVCQNELPYHWRNKTIYETGIYRDTVENNLGKQTITGIKVVVLPVVHAPEPIIASICEGDTYKWGDLNLTQQGNYYDTLTAANGCDSIVMLALTVHPTEYVSEQKKIYEGDSIFFNNEWLKEPGIYEIRTVNGNGCTNTYQLILTVLQQFNRDTTAVVCANDLPFVWRGIEYSETGDYTRATSWSDSSRVMTTLHLTVYPVYYDERSVDICSGAGAFEFRGKHYRESGSFYDTVPSINGCDSVFKITVRVHPTYVQRDTVQISDKQTYTWRLVDGDGTVYERVLSKEGNYEMHLKTKFTQCDSSVYLQLYVHPSYLFEQEEEICQKDTFFWHGKKYYNEGIYYDSLLSHQGFDSVYSLKLTVHPTYAFDEKVNICPGRTTYLHGINISDPGYYLDTLYTIHGCDSIYRITVNWAREFRQEYDVTICEEELPYMFYGIPHSKGGTLIHEIGCDSVIICHLNVLPSDTIETRIVISEEDLPYLYEGKYYRSGGMYSKSYSNQNGCDSTRILNLVISQHASQWYQMPLCPGSEIKIDDQVITKSGLYSFLRRSKISGLLDSLYRVEVYDAPAYDLPLETRTICDGDTVFYGGKAITRAGHYDFELETVLGCDSLLHLDVIINPSYHFYEDATIADYENFTWRGKTYMEAGEYSYTWPTVDDCDSTHTLRLYVMETERHLTEDSICEGQTYTWRGKEYTQTGYYTDTIYRPETFYSAIYTLQLTTLRPTLITGAKVGEACADAGSFDIEFTYSGARPTRYSIYFDQLAKNEGFTDIINQPFLGEDRVARAPIPTKQDVVYLEHTNYVRPDRYSMRLVLDNGVCGISRSDSLLLLIKYPSWIIEQNWDDVVVPLRKELNGGYDFALSDWYVNGELQPNSSRGYLHSDKLKVGDEVVMVATRKGESYSIPTCPLVITTAAPDVYDNPILVYPTQAPRHMPVITIEAPQGGQYAIYSSTGVMVTDGEIESGAQQVRLPNVSGIYFIRTSNGKESQTHKVMIY